MTEDSGTSTYQYAQGTSRLTAISGAQATSFGYNANGNITSKSNKVFVYNEDDRISRVWLGNNQPLAAYVYDLQGRRLRKYTAGQTCYYHYDQDGWLVAETDAAGGLVRGYVRLDGQPLAMITGDGSIYYYHNDHLGTPLRMTDATGTVVWAADYRPFGKAELLVNTVENNLRLPGQYFDSETGLHYNWHRFYDPQTGRYISADPIGLDGGMNLYGYVGNDPVNWIDPDGLIPYDIEGQSYAAAGDMLKNYVDMLRANYKNQDKYFHCKANCEAAQRGELGRATSQAISELREFSDAVRKGDTEDMCNADRAANQTGRNAGEKNPFGDCRKACEQYRPKGLPTHF